MDTTRLILKGFSWYTSIFYAYHGRSRGEFGLQMDSTEAHLGTEIPLEIPGNYMKLGNLGVVARDGIEPPTPAFSGLLTDFVKFF
jgi:hypothetical protein